MRLGQTSAVHFGSRLLSSALGFVATIYIARLLGADALGTYSLGLTVASWLGIAGNLGVSGAITKRVSEGEEPSAFAVAGVVIMGLLFLSLAALLFVFEPWVNDYVGFPATGFIVLMLGVSLAFSVATSLLNGRHLVHVSGILSPVRTGVRAILQIGAITLGLGIAGLFGGYVAGYLVVVLVASGIIIRDLNGITRPSGRHFRKLFSYAKFSWLGSVRSRAFSWVDIAVLGFFVPQAFIGYYTAAWNLSQFLIIFGASLSSTLFPEMSKLSTQENPEAISDLLDSALSYAGLILIPGLVGGTILSNRILRIYGEDFTQATTVFVILVVANLFQAYQKQLTTTLNAIDRPDIAFRVNAVFIGANVVLNVAFIYLYGFVGAAVATATSVAISLLVAYQYLSALVEFEIPVREIARQWAAAGFMGVVVFAALLAEARFVDLGHNFAVVLILVFLGAGTYFIALLALSPRFRTTVADNLPAGVVPATK